MPAGRTIKHAYLGLKSSHRRRIIRSKRRPAVNKWHSSTSITNASFAFYNILVASRTATTTTLRREHNILLSYDNNVRFMHYIRRRNRYCRIRYKFSKRAYSGYVLKLYTFYVH